MKPELLMIADEMLRLDPPVFVKVSGCVWLLPNRTLPRLMLEGALR